MSENLDIKKHYPANFLGKVFSVNGAIYSVECFLEQGQERVVYRARNERSGVMQHVLKLMRDQSGLRHNGAYTNTPTHAHKIAENMLAEVFVPGVNGYAFIQPAFERDIPACEDTLPDTSRMSLELQSSNEYNERDKASLIERILEISPHNTIALSKKLESCENDKEAFVCCLNLLDVEPNVPWYYWSSIEKLLQLSAQDSCIIEIFDRMRRVFPYTTHNYKEWLKVSVDKDRLDAAQHILDCTLTIDEAEASRWRPAIYKLRSNILRGVPSKEYLRAKAHASIAFGSLEVADSLFKQVVEKNGSAQDWNSIAQVKLSLGAYRDAVACIDQVSTTSELWSVAQLTKMSALFELKDWNSILDVWSMLEKKETVSAQHALLLVHTYLGMGKLDEARYLVTNCMRGDPDDADIALQYIRLHMSEADPRDLLKICEAFQTQEIPQFVDFEFLRGSILVRTENYPEAYMCFIECSKHRPFDSDVYVSASIAVASAGLLGMSLEYLRIACDLAPDDSSHQVFSADEIQRKLSEVERVIADRVSESDWSNKVDVFDAFHLCQSGKELFELFSDFGDQKSELANELYEYIEHQSVKAIILEKVLRSKFRGLFNAPVEKNPEEVSTGDHRPKLTFAESVWLESQLWAKGSKPLDM